MTSKNNVIALEIHNQEVIQCGKCPRLVQWREETAKTKRRAYLNEEYWAKPVPAFGDPYAKVIVVGLAPGAHGSNRTGRMFTGDASGDFLYPALFRAGFANHAITSQRYDGLILKDILITAVCRCAPPGNKPLKSEIKNCLPFLMREIAIIHPQGFVALGRVAFENVLAVFHEIYRNNLEIKASFYHAAFYRFKPGLPWLLASYHPSRQNTQTKRLTSGMFDDIWQRVKLELSN